MASPLIRTLAGIALLAGASAALAQAYPSKPIRMILGVSTGSSSGILARVVVAGISKELGQNMVIENMAGAGGTVGMATAAKAAPDGYTLAWITQAQAISESLYEKLNYRLLDDFAPITQVATGYYLLVVTPKVPARSVKELIALAKSRPGALNYGSSGNGTGTHLAAALFTSKGGLDIVHVPYKGTSPGLTAFLADEVQMYFLGATSVTPLIKSGKARALAVTSSKRSPAFPDLPTLGETLPGYEMSIWQGIAAPARTPEPVIQAVYDATLRALKSPEIRAKFDELDAQIETSNPAAFRAYLKEQVALLRDAVKASGAKVE
jgi:tripartite-type tricarboxylate transporter receptor subunit TctC